MSRRLHSNCRSMTVKYEQIKEIEDKFWGKVKITSEEDCWEWQSYCGKDGYARVQFRVNGNKLHERGHRVSTCLELKRDIEDTEVVRHSCDNPPCVNPNHLKVGNHYENVMDRVKRGRSATGEENGKSQLTRKQVSRVYDSFQAFVKEKAENLGVDEKTIRCICNEKTWKNVSN